MQRTNSPAASEQAVKVPTACWCGNTELAAWGRGYQLCDLCQTLVAEIQPAQIEPRVKNESSDLYGRDYWFDHQTSDLGCPDIITRSRSDLSERAIHWLRSVLQFKLPPATVLEIGCAHGGFVGMLNQAGFNARGLELSPAIVQLARDTFQIDVLTGPVEDQSIAGESLDLIVMMDVMEHLPRPLTTLGRCIELLKPDGILLVQTPQYPEGKSLLQLQNANHKFPMMLDPGEHLLLFSQSSARKIFAQLGAPFIQFIPAVFGFYDMSFVVSKRPIVAMSTIDQERALQASVGSRMMQALLDADTRRLNLLEKYRSLKAIENRSNPQAGL